MFVFVHNYSTGTACICFSTNIPAFATVPLGQTHHVSLTLPLAAPVLKPLFSFLVSQFSMAKHNVFGSCIFTQNTFCFTIRPGFYFSFTDLSRNKCNPIAIWVLLPSLMALAKKEAQAATSPMWGSYSLIPGLSIWPAKDLWHPSFTAISPSLQGTRSMAKNSFPYLGQDSAPFVSKSECTQGPVIL